MKPTKDLNRIINAVSKDSRSAFDCFYNIYYEKVFNFAYYFLPDIEACKEVVTEVFFSVWQSRARLKDIINLETWLYVIVRNETLKYKKAANRFATVSLDDNLSIVAELEAQNTNSSPEDTLIDKEIEELLTEVINNLPEKCRLIFTMSRYDGLKTKEIAEILSLQESTVRVQIKIAIEKIMKEMKTHFPNMSFVCLLTTLFNEKHFL